MSDLGSMYSDLLKIAQYSPVKDKRYAYTRGAATVWSTPFQNTFLSSRFSKEPMRDLACALWLYAGCRNLPEMYKLGATRRPVPNPRYGCASMDHDYIETISNVNMALEEGDVFTIFAKHGEANGSVSWETSAQMFPSFTLSYSMEDGGVHGTASFMGGDMGTIFRIVLPAIAMINRRVLTNAGETFFRLVFNNVRTNTEVMRDHLRQIGPDRYQIAENDWLASLDTKELFSVIDDPTQMGGTQVMRRILKPIMLAGMAEAEEEGNLIDYVRQLPDGAMKEQLLDFYG
jgi:hypothetical protein